MAGRQSGSGPVKISIVGGGQRGSKVWRRERIEMTNDPDLDDCAFLSGKMCTNKSDKNVLFKFKKKNIQSSLYSRPSQCLLSIQYINKIFCL